MVDEPTEEESIAILKGLRSRYEEHHKVEITIRPGSRGEALHRVHQRPLPAG